MSAYSNLTYIAVVDAASFASLENFGLTEFSNYNEAMSYSKFLAIELYALNASYKVYVWNVNGNSGYWQNNAFFSVPNSNWP